MTSKKTRVLLIVGVILFGFLSSYLIFPKEIIIDIFPPNERSFNITLLVNGKVIHTQKEFRNSTTPIRSPDLIYNTKRVIGIWFTIKIIDSELNLTKESSFFIPAGKYIMIHLDNIISFDQSFFRPQYE